MLGEFGEELQLDGAQEDLRGPEACAYLQNMIRTGFVHMGFVHLRQFSPRIFELPFVWGAGMHSDHTGKPFKLKEKM